MTSLTFGLALLVRPDTTPLRGMVGLLPTPPPTFSSRRFDSRSRADTREIESVSPTFPDTDAELRQQVVHLRDALDRGDHVVVRVNSLRPDRLHEPLLGPPERERERGRLAPIQRVGHAPRAVLLVSKDPLLHDVPSRRLLGRASHG